MDNLGRAGNDRLIDGAPAADRTGRPTPLPKQSERWFRSVMRNNPDVISILDGEGILRYVSPAVERVLGYHPDEIIGTFAFDYVHPDDAERASSVFGETLTNPGANLRLEFRLRHKDGFYRCLEINFKNLLDDPVVKGIVVDWRDISERKAAEEQLKYRTFYDFSTDLPNRQLFVDRLQHALKRVRRRRKRKLAVLVVDLDNFKVVNDSLGHMTRDQLLRAVAERLQTCLHPEDTLSRFGDAQFGVLVEDITKPSDAAQVAERLTQGLRTPFTLDGQEVFITATIGIALSAPGHELPEDLLSQADTAMHLAKESSDANYQVYDSSMHHRALEGLELENDLRRALEREELRIYYQPKVSLISGKPLGVEALVRWEHPQRGLVFPTEFVALAEETGLIIPLGRWVLHEACRQGREWEEKHSRIPRLTMSVNLSAKQLQHPDVVRTVEGALQESGFEGTALNLDITETAYIEVLADHADALDKLRHMGVRISIDDFGKGYSSLSYLKRLPADVLKIDKEFVKGVGEDVVDTAIVQMMVDLAHALGMEVVVEGVEREEQAEQLKEMGCDLAQGYHFSKPLPPEVAEEFLTS